MNDKLYPELKLEKNRSQSKLNENEMLNECDKLNLETKLKQINKFHLDLQHIKDIKNFYESEVNKYKKSLKRIKILNKIILSIDAITVVGVTSTSITLSLTGVGLLTIPIASGFAAGLCVSGKILHGYFCSIQTKNEKKHSLATKTLVDFSSLYKNSLKDGVIDQDEYNKLIRTSTEYKNNKSKIIQPSFLD